MARHLRASHTDCQCFWRCQVSSCPMWFSSELNGKDHLERIHNFTEGRGYSFYDCLRQFGLEWFGRRSFFDQCDVTGQGLWMDLALARRSGQALHNNYTITNSSALAPLRKFFRGRPEFDFCLREPCFYTSGGGPSALDLLPNAPGNIPGFSGAHRFNRFGSGSRHSCGGVAFTFNHLIRHTTAGRGCSILFNHAKQPVLDLSTVGAVRSSPES